MDIWEILEQCEHWFDPTHMFCISGVMLFAAWLLRTSLGRRALDRVPIRRHNMSFHVPFITFLVWMGPPYWIGMALASTIKDRPSWQKALVDNVIMAFSWILAIAVFLILARVSFARGLRGFGLRGKGIFRDFGAACMYLLSIWPLVLAMIVVVSSVGQWIFGSDYEISRHIALEKLVHDNQWSLTLSIVLLAVVIAPLVEEMLFRGFIQSMFRSVLDRPWSAVFLTSLFFSISHANIEHWPALFVLSMGMGYAYEKTGSLWRPIFIHALFNGLTVVSYVINK